MSWSSKKENLNRPNIGEHILDSDSNSEDEGGAYGEENSRSSIFSSLPCNLSKCANAYSLNLTTKDKTCNHFQQPCSNRLYHSLQSSCEFCNQSEITDTAQIPKTSTCTRSEKTRPERSHLSLRNASIDISQNRISPPVHNPSSSFPLTDQISSSSIGSHSTDLVVITSKSSINQLAWPISKGTKNDILVQENQNSTEMRIDSQIPGNMQNTSEISDIQAAHVTGPLYNWQASMPTIKERFAFLFNNEVLSDVHFCVGKGDASQKVPAHKFVLSAGSAVFDAMFNGRLCTKQDEIELPDVEPQAFLALLRFLYSDEVQIDPETVMTVLYTAKKYAVPALERHCVEFLKCNLSSDNAFMLLTQARLFDEPQLAFLCLDTIDKNTTDALLADGFTDIDHNTLCLVLERDTLRIRELKLYQAVVRWSEEKCRRDNMSLTSDHQRVVLGRALTLVRFPLMTIEEFAQCPAQSDILTDREKVELFLYFTVNPKPAVSFLDVPRCCMTGKEVTMCRFLQIESRWGYSGTSDRIRFIVDRRIFVVGFGMYGSTHGPSEYEITIQIIHTATGKVCASNDTNFISDGSVRTFRVMFKEPVEITPNTNYTAYATLKGSDSHYGTKGLRKISVECPSGERVTFQFTYAAGHNNGTSVEDGQIPEIIFYT